MCAGIIANGIKLKAVSPNTNKGIAESCGRFPSSSLTSSYDVDHGKLYIYSTLIKKYRSSVLLASPMPNALLSTGPPNKKVGQNKNFNALLKKFLCLVGDGIGVVSGMG